MKYIVYLTNNIKNQHIYVGVHKTENPDIFDGYLGNGVNRFNPSSMYNSKAPFCLAVQKYGFDSFKRSIIKIFDTEQEALDLEAEIVNEEFIKRKDTYNITLGGGMPPLLNKIIYQYDLNGKYIQSFNSIKEAEQKLNCKLLGINESIKMEQQYKGFLWRRGEKLDEINPYKPSKSSARKVGQYTMDNMLVKTFNTVREARKEFPNVSKVLKGLANHCHNFKFKYIE